MSSFAVQRIVAMTVIAGAAIGISQIANAATPSTSCSTESLSGVYTYSYTGFSIAANHTRVPFAVSGVGLYDGHGHVKGASTTTTTDGKQSGAKPVAYTGVYTVSPNCHGTEVDTDGSGAKYHYDQFTGPSGKSVSFVETDTNVVSTGMQTRD